MHKTQDPPPAHKTQSNSCISIRNVIASLWILLLLPSIYTCNKIEVLDPDPCICDEDDVLQTQHGSYLTENIIVVVIDGVRFSESGGDPNHTYTKHIYNDLASQGIRYSNFYNDGNTRTISGHTAILTGKDQVVNNDGKEFPLCPSFLQLWLSKTQVAPKNAWIISSKPKLNVLSNSNHIDWRASYMPSVNAGYSNSSKVVRADGETLKKAVEILGRDHPKLSVVLFAGPDVRAHGNNWNGYIDAIKETDSLTNKLWQFIQSDDQYAGKTSMFITNDHGRHLDNISDGFISHGDGCFGCRHLNFVAIGPDIKSGIQIDHQRDQTDIAPTIAEMMGFRMPGCDGTIMYEIFK